MRVSSSRRRVDPATSSWIHLKWDQTRRQNCCYADSGSGFWLLRCSVSTGGIDPLVRGAIGTAADTHNTDMFLSDEVTDRLIVLNVPRHMDLAALNLQRGRDHALPGW